MNAPLQFFPIRTPLDLASSMIRLEAVDKIYPARKGQEAVPALRGINLTVPRSGITGVIGRSGAGKSTLIRLVNGLESASSGNIVIDGANVTAHTEAQWREDRRSIGMIFQHFNLLSARTVGQNIALPLEIIGTPQGQIKKRVSELLALVGLQDKAARFPAELSGGQKQRVGIARALATNPKILLCDEATSALDPETTRSILSLLDRVNQELGVTILLITHEIPVIKELCHHVAVLEAGRIIEQGDVFDVLTRPKHATTASFVKNVTGIELPAGFAARLGPLPRAGGQTVIRVDFSGANATEPVISRLTRLIDTELNILAGRIDTIGNRPFGSLILAIPTDESASAAVLSGLSRLDLSTEVLGYVS
jgi:D-methionine transport system ATP-binding protein